MRFAFSKISRVTLLSELALFSCKTLENHQNTPAIGVTCVSFQNKTEKMAEQSFYMVETMKQEARSKKQEQQILRVWRWRKISQVIPSYLEKLGFNFASWSWKIIINCVKFVSSLCQNLPDCVNFLQPNDFPIYILGSSQ